MTIGVILGIAIGIIVMLALFALIVCVLSAVPDFDDLDDDWEELWIKKG